MVSRALPSGDNPRPLGRGIVEFNPIILRILSSNLTNKNSEYIGTLLSPGFSLKILQKENLALTPPDLRSILKVAGSSRRALQHPTKRQSKEAKMKKDAILTEPQYTKLVREIRALIEEGRQRADFSARQELVQTYWKIGKRISEEGLTQSAGYNQAILADLSEELAIDYTTLTRCIHFFQAYNIATSSKRLTWSHYKSLLPINDEEERKWYENLAETEGLTVPNLSQAIKADRYGESVKSDSEGQATRRLTRPTKATYIYKAVVDRVIDGDTLLLKIDLGFQVWKEQRLRLTGIDTPAMDEPGGQEAYRFVLGQLAKVDFVMVKTNKIDIYGRYVGHIFYSSRTLSKDETFTKGEYLNQGLVSRGLAKIV